ncbi:hypothetical protein Bbelb_195710 [Branchiostoma belcheri]|nr:hypothetical protein Bbelb_195710 [Branchiostoma belcheri]
MSGHVTNPSYFTSFVKPAPSEVADSRRNTVATPNASTTQTTSGNQPVDASLPAAGYSPGSERDFPPRAERLAAPGGTGIERPGIPKIVTVLSGSSSALLALAIPAGSHGTERRDAVEVVGQSRSEKLKVSDNLKGGWRWRADFGSLLIVFWSLGDYRQQEEKKPKEMYPYPRVWGTLEDEALGREGVGYPVGKWVWNGPRSFYGPRPVAQELLASLLRARAQ